MLSSNKISREYINIILAFCNDYIFSHVAVQILAASPRQCICSQRCKHPVVPEKKVAVFEQPPYSPDLTACEVFLFPTFKGIVKLTGLEGLEAMKRAVTTELRVSKMSFKQSIKASQGWIENDLDSWGLL